jgi:hypothetical protein
MHHLRCQNRIRQCTHRIEYFVECENTFAGLYSPIHAAEGPVARPSAEVELPAEVQPFAVVEARRVVMVV